MKLNSTQKLIAVIVGAVVLAALAVFLLIVPQLTAMGRLDTQIDQSEQDVSAARTLLAQRQQIKLNSAQTETQLLRLANELPESPQLPEFIMELQDTINESGLEFSTLEPSPPVANQGYKAIPITITVQGTWQDIVDLMSRLRRITRQVRITEFSVFPGELDPAAETTTTVSVAIPLRAEIVVEIYTIDPVTSQETTVPAAPAAQ